MPLPVELRGSASRSGGVRAGRHPAAPERRRRRGSHDPRRGHGNDPGGLRHTLGVTDESGSQPAPAVAHYANGRVKYTGFKLNGDFHGEWQFFRADGSLMRTGAFDRGRQVGVWRTYDRAGNALKATDFWDGR